MQRILVPIDFSAVTPAVIRQAVDLAADGRAEVTLLYIAAPEPDFVGYRPGPASVRKTQTRKVCSERRELGDYKRRLEQAGVKTRALQIQGVTVEKILREAKRWKADLIVIGSHGHGKLYKLLLGSTSEAVVRRAACPVLIVPSGKK
jgi:nucleotide-binding universal stress UspA family protein